MTFEKVLPYLATILASAIAVWQYLQNRKYKKQRVKYQTYLKISEVVSSFDREFDSFLSVLSITNFKKTKDSLNLLKQMIKEFELKLEKTKEEQKNIQTEISDINSTRQRKNYLISSELERLDLLSNKLESMKETFNENENELETLNNLHENASLEYEISIQKISKSIESLSIKLDDCLSEFNAIGDLKIISSEKVVYQHEIVRQNNLKLKMFIDDIIFNGFSISDASDLVKSDELINFQTSSKKLLKIMQKELA
jgi:hypothetical protein